MEIPLILGNTVPFITIEIKGDNNIIVSLWGPKDENSDFRLALISQHFDSFEKAVSWLDKFKPTMAALDFFDLDERPDPK